MYCFEVRLVSILKLAPLYELALYDPYRVPWPSAGQKSMYRVLIRLRSTPTMRTYSPLRDIWMASSGQQRARQWHQRPDGSG